MALDRVLWSVEQTANDWEPLKAEKKVVQSAARMAELLASCWVDMKAVQMVGTKAALMVGRMVVE